MKFISTRGKSPAVTASQAILNGLAPDGGLYVPESFPEISMTYLKNLPYSEFASRIIQPFFEGDPLFERIPEICSKSFTFDVPLHWLEENKGILELFHGPTAAFKDFGARFLSNVLEILQEGNQKELTILVATSGDTGSAVASAFYLKKGINVKVLFPEGLVSFRQEKQLTCWDANIQSYSVKGTFDDCQKLVKEAFQSKNLKKQWQLSSANSISLGRLLPQMVYYVYAALHYYARRSTYPSFIIPSGNVGNSVGAYWAKECGAPLGKIVLAVNANKTIPDYLDSGVYSPRKSIPTIANAMDVGNPSNMERLIFLFKDFDVLKKNISAYSVSDNQMRETIKRTYETRHYIICPHTAAGEWVREKYFQDEESIVVSTAHPAKFDLVVEAEIGRKVPVPDSLSDMLEKESSVTTISPNLESLFDI